MTTAIPEIVCSLLQKHPYPGDGDQNNNTDNTGIMHPHSSDEESDSEYEHANNSIQRQMYSPPCPILESQHHVNLQDKSGKSLLIHSCARGLKCTVEELSLDPNIDVNLGDIEGNTALIHAAQAGHNQIVELLIERFANLEIDQVNKLGQTALIKSAIQGRVNCARLLLKAGADPYKRDNSRQFTALEWAEFVGRTECAKVIAGFMEPRRRDKKALPKAKDNLKQVACLAAIPLIGGEIRDVPAFTRPRVRSAPPTPSVKIKITPPSSPFWNTGQTGCQQQQFPFRAVDTANHYYSAFTSSKSRPLRKYSAETHHHHRPKSSAS